MASLLDMLQSLNIIALNQRITRLEKHMATTDEIVTRLNDATSRIAAKLQALVDEVAGGDAAIAAKFEPVVTELEAMGADPADPVPAPAPADPQPV